MCMCVYSLDKLHLKNKSIKSFKYVVSVVDEKKILDLFSSLKQNEYTLVKHYMVYYIWYILQIQTYAVSK